MGWIPAQVLEWPLDRANVELISIAIQGCENGLDGKTKLLNWSSRHGTGG